jgi:hypothetical protein
MRAGTGRSGVFGFVCGLSLVTASPASAQLFEIARTDQSVVSTFGSDAAYDSVHDCYFVVSGFPEVAGQFVDRAGRPLGPALTLDRSRAFYVSPVVYSPDLSDGAGGRGGFMVIWSPESANNSLIAQVVSFPGRLVGTPRTIFAASRSWITSSDVDYSPVDRMFLVGVEYFKFDAVFDAPSRLLRLDLSSQVIGDVPLSSDPNFNCFQEGYWWCDIHVKWNPVAGEFGVLYRQSVGTAQNHRTDRVFARVRGNGSIVYRATIVTGSSQGGGHSALAVNPTLGSYVVLDGPGSLSQLRGIELGPDGTLLAKGLVASDFPADFNNPLRISYSRASGTFLLARATNPPGSFAQLRELNQHGVQLPSTLPLAAPWVAVSSHPFVAEWIVAIQDGTTRMIGTSTRFGGSDELLPDCLTPDPFVSLGGGRCVNRGWLPPGHPLIPPGPPPEPPPPPPPAGCTIPDPFTSLGGGVCVNGGWVPRGHPLAGGGS